MEQLFDHLSCDTDRQQERPCLVSVWMGKAEVERDPGVLTGPCHTTAFMTDVRSPGVRQVPSHTAKSEVKLYRKSLLGSPYAGTSLGRPSG